MKHTGIIISLCCLFSSVLIAQDIPQGMNYQAIARDANGKILAHQEITVKVALESDPEALTAAYSEMHVATTNQFGLFTLTIGKGKHLQGDFNAIPWSRGEIWMHVAMKFEGSDTFIPVSHSRLLSVPYAFHAMTASDLARPSGGGRGNEPGVNSQTWSLFGNSNSDPADDKLGTTDTAALSIVTDNVERVRVTEDGDVIIHNNMDVGKNVDLNTTEGNTTVNGDLTVENMSSTHLTGTLDVDKALNVDGVTDLNDSLNVNNMAPTYLTGTLEVEKSANFEVEITVGGALNLNDSLNVHEMAPTHLSGTLTVDKETDLKSSLKVTDENSGFIAEFENTQNGNGDGLKIKLGKTHPRWLDNPPPPFSNEVSAQIPGFTFFDAAVQSVKDLIKGLMTDPGNTFNADNFNMIGNELLTAFESEIGGSVEDYASAACNLTNDIIGEINGALGLPYDDFSTIHIPGLPVVPYIEFLDIGPYGTPAANVNTGFPAIPAIPSINCPAPPSLSDFSLPSFRITDVPNSLTHENQYIQFVDKDNRQVGTIRAESIDEWCNRYLDLTYFLNVFNSFAGVTEISIDPVALSSTLAKYAINGLTQIANVAAAYNSIGVEYSSGFGDYAEWLMRENTDEPITAGDIVAVKSGKITRDLSEAEQVMAVSSKPIVLGNTPPKGEEHLGNKVAFMGQIPVKVMGPVQSGDFIVADHEIPGYGVAIHPAAMAAEDFALAVGRSWETIPGNGPKLVNTVVGVHNGDYLHILIGYQKQLEQTDSRLSSIEEKLEMLLPEVAAKTNTR